MTPPLVRMEGILKAFPGVLALDGVDFELEPGEIHALAGENGSGKSTLVKILYGAHQADAGTIHVNGKPVSFSSPRQAIEHGIVAISQELTLAPTLTVAENILMGRLPRRRGAIDWLSARRLARRRSTTSACTSTPAGASRSCPSSSSRRSRWRGPSPRTRRC